METPSRVTGKTLRENVEGAECYRREVIRTAAEPLHPEGGTVVLYGNLAPDGAVIKQTAASPQLLQHRGKAYVFENYRQMRAQIDSRGPACRCFDGAGHAKLRS